MLGKLTDRGIVNGCRLEDVGLMLLVSSADGRPGVWLPAEEALQNEIPMADRYKRRTLHSLELGSRTHAEV